MDMNKFAGSESKYLKAADLMVNGKSQSLKVTIAGVNIVEFENDDGKKEQKPALEIQGKEKQVVCNATTVNELMQAYGVDSDAWIGQDIGLSTKHYASLGKDGLVVTAIKDFVDSDITF